MDTIKLTEEPTTLTEVAELPEWIILQGTGEAVNIQNVKIKRKFTKHTVPGGDLT
jgi:hypothetical protein